MRYAKLVFGLAIDGPFDYSVPACFNKNIRSGQRVKVNFNHGIRIGYVTALSKTSSIAETKPILEIIDDQPVLDKAMLLLTKKVSEYYSCAWGEVIESALPVALRRGKTVHLEKAPAGAGADPKAAPEEKKQLLLQASIHSRRWKEYAAQIGRMKELGKSVLVIVPDLASALSIQEMLNREYGIQTIAKFGGQAQEASVWEAIHGLETCVVVGTRSAVFAPVQNLGLIIVEEEQDTVYKQEQSPHYHAVMVARMRARLEGAGLILGSSAASVESFYLAHARPRHRAIFDYRSLDQESQMPEVKAVFARELYSKRFSKGKILTYYLEDAISRALAARKKILILVNRKGFATYASCQSCGTPLQCPRCELNLVYYFEEGKLRCNHCAFSMDKPIACPACKTGLIHFTGVGVEKVESELTRIFPQARIKIAHTADDSNILASDIIVSTSHILKKDELFDLAAVLSVDTTLNRNDFRASEKVFSMLAGLRGMVRSQLAVQTMLSRHHVFDALVKNDLSLFYEKELELRAQLSFPPFWHMVAVNIRGPDKEKARACAESTFSRLKESNTRTQIQLMSMQEGPFPKLRGNYYYQILLKSPRVSLINAFLKAHLKKMRYSGILMSVDVDPL